MHLKDYRKIYQFEIKKQRTKHKFLRLLSIELQRGVVHHRKSDAETPFLLRMSDLLTEQNQTIVMANRHKDRVMCKKLVERMEGENEEMGEIQEMFSKLYDLLCLIENVEIEGDV